MTTDPGTRAEIAAAITGRLATIDTAGAVDVAVAEGVAPLLAASPAAATLDAPSRARLLAAGHGTTIHAAALDDELRRLLPALAIDGRAPLVIKGAHLAHAIYPTPSRRPRVDTDLLIAPAQRDAIARALQAEGYAPGLLTSGSLILGQFLYQKTLGPGIIHYVDVHWRAAAPLVFAEAFDAATIDEGSVAIPALGPLARGPAAADALALACVHLVAHHWPEAALLWLYDLRLLADALDDPSRDRFARAAAQGRYRDVAACALTRARELFPSPGLDAAIDRLRSVPAGAELSAALTRPNRPPVFLLDLRVAGWRRGATLLREHLLPPPSYMRMAFAGRPLPIAYAERLVRAVRKRL